MSAGLREELRAAVATSEELLHHSRAETAQALAQAEERLNAARQEAEAQAMQASTMTRDEFVKMYAREWAETKGQESPNKVCMVSSYISARAVGSIETLPRATAVQGGRGSKGKGPTWERTTHSQVRENPCRKTMSRRQKSLHLHALDLAGGEKYMVPLFEAHISARIPPSTSTSACV